MRYAVSVGQPSGIRAASVSLHEVRDQAPELYLYSVNRDTDGRRFSGGDGQSGKFCRPGMGSDSKGLNANRRQSPPIAAGGGGD